MSYWLDLGILCLADEEKLFSFRDVHIQTHMQKEVSAVC